MVSDPRVYVIWAAYYVDDLKDTVIDIICKFCQVQRHEIHFEIADLSRPRIPNSLIVVNNQFPMQSFLSDWERYNVPFVALSIDDNVQPERIPFTMCKHFLTLKDILS